MISNTNKSKWSGEELDRQLLKSSAMASAGDRVVFLSGLFLGVPYAPATLTGGDSGPEEFIVNIDAVDCFTLLDYVESMRRSGSYGEFIEQLIKTRYRDGVVSYANRNHFFTDWAIYNSGFVRDMTADIGGAKLRRLVKVLNLKEDGSPYVPGIPPVERSISWIPSGRLCDEGLDRLHSGDYAGIYSVLPGLDVSHVGIIVRYGSDIIFRHASELQGKVVDEDFSNYIRQKEGVVILRPLP